MAQGERFPSRGEDWARRLEVFGVLLGVAAPALACLLFALYLTDTQFSGLARYGFFPFRVPLCALSVPLANLILFRFPPPGRADSAEAAKPRRVALRGALLGFSLATSILITLASDHLLSLAALTLIIGLGLLLASPVLATGITLWLAASRRPWSKSPGLGLCALLFGVATASTILLLPELRGDSLRRLGS